MREFAAVAGQAMWEAFGPMTLVVLAAAVARWRCRRAAARHWWSMAGLVGSALVFAWQWAPVSSEMAPGDGSRAMPWLGAAWMVAAGALSLRVVGGWWVLRRMIARAAPLPRPDWAALCARAGLPTVPALLVAEGGETAFAAGVWRQVVVVPAAWLAALPADQFEAILLHELAHLRRQDFAWEMLQRAVEAVCCFHPAVWWLSAVARADRESACDDAAVAAGARASALAEALVAMEEARVLAPAASGGSTGERVRRLLGAAPVAARRASWVPVVLWALTLALGLLAQGPRVSDAYRKWVAEDVVWIIEPREKAAFERLLTDEECKHFIEQFWQVRPAPMKEEHYRRIAKANEKFKEGWRGEQGRTYIRFGPPDEIEVHKAQNKEAWLYRNLPGIGTNVIFNFGTPPGK